MLTCVPQSICSWDYQIRGASCGAAAVTMNFLSEQGKITLGNSELTVNKQGVFSGRWALEDRGKTVADANKPNALFRSFELGIGSLRFIVEAHSGLTRSYDIRSAAKILGIIRPEHPFTRRARIECTAEVPEIAQLFAFWLVVLTWKRAAASD